MEKKITIERREKFAGSAIKYFIVLNMSEGEFNQNVGMRERLSLGEKSAFLSKSKKVFPLSNGDAVTIENLEAENSFFVMAFTSTGKLFSERVFVDSQDNDARYSVSLRLGIFKNEFVIERL